MKKILAFIMLFVFLCFKCLTWIPIAAATGIPAFDAFYYAILQTLGMAYTNGVEMDLAPAIAEVRENIPDYLQQPDNAVKYLLRDYAGKLWDNSILQWQDSANEPAVVANISAIRLAGTEVSTPTLKDIVSQYQKKALDNDYNVVTPINSDAIAFWNKYNSLYINEYLDKINALPDDIVVPTPDPQFVVFIDRINESGFWFKDFPNKNNDNNSIEGLVFFPPDTTSWIASNSSVNFNANSDYYYVVTTDILSLNITSSAGNYYFAYNISDSNVIRNFVLPWSPYSGKPNGYIRRSNNMFGIANTSDTANSINYSISGSLGEVLNYISMYFRNVNLYVDGVLWSTVDNTFTNNFNSTVPNAVIDNSTDDGKIVSNPIYWTVDENTGLPIDSQINLDKLIDYLKGIIDGTNSDTSVNYGDLVDAGVIEKQDGSAITDANVISVPVADAIDDALADNPAIDEPIAAIGELPPLPPLPPFFPTPDLPDGDPTSGFHGISVLARIINITNQSLPSDVIIVFYGVIFGAVVLGLIKILHK